MKYLSLLLLLFFSCATKQNAVDADNALVNTFSVCPEDGVCSMEILYDQNLSIEKDGIGALYPKISKGDKVILKFEYKRNEIQNTVDGQYSELVYLELDPDNLDLNLEDITLKKVKALFARLCFCRGQTGYYPINQGELSIKKDSNNQYRLKMTFTISEVPQVVSTIETLFHIK